MYPYDDQKHLCVTNECLSSEPSMSEAVKKCPQEKVYRQSLFEDK